MFKKKFLHINYAKTFANSKISITAFVLSALFVICLLGQILEPLVGKYASGISGDAQNARVAKWAIELSELSEESLYLPASIGEKVYTEFIVSNNVSESVSKVNEVLTNYYFVLETENELDISKIKAYIQYEDGGFSYSIDATNVSEDNKTFKIENKANPSHWHFLPASESQNAQSRTLRLYFEFAEEGYSIDGLGIKLNAYFEQIQ